MDKIKRLLAYADKIKFALDQTKDIHKKAFFERELRKTTAKIEALRK